ncbi:hypothetical protein PIB30_095599, partial [Stylosanthes scabra]|nr:hypothetical protein [Stylosanthes scabra]
HVVSKWKAINRSVAFSSFNRLSTERKWLKERKERGNHEEKLGGQFNCICERTHGDMHMHLQELGVTSRLESGAYAYVPKAPVRTH